MTHMTVIRVRVYIVYRLNIWTGKYSGNKHSKNQFAHTNVLATLTWLSGTIFTYIGWSIYEIWSTFSLQTIEPLWRNYTIFFFFSFRVWTTLSIFLVLEFTNFTDCWIFRYLWPMMIHRIGEFMFIGFMTCYYS